MEQEIISKKDLLELTGLSYGQLYRWKRKNLIPEDWFIRKSTFTGQETFFPKHKILARIDKIKHMKDDLSLDELADLLSPHPTEISLWKQEILERNIVSNMSLNFYIDRLGDTDIFSFDRILHLFILEKMLQTGEMSLDEGAILLQVLSEHYPKLQGSGGEIIFIRKMGVSSFLLCSSSGEVFFESGIRVVTRLNVAVCIEELKMKIN
ncbi:YhbD family protein [Paenibacillus sp. UNC451MF]|uniref:YhbD family protein n=1 Tax=Paenibacillus sp. UNC451MF TaxID=1449063 RepID=UPI00048F5A80|nr:YhbD family protein [Paenibacillus sp. UNC451MF]